jgi:hypothetical protein
MEKSERMTGYNELKAWMERRFGARTQKVNITHNGKSYTGHMYGNDECFDGDEFHQYFLTEDALLRIYYDIPEGCTDFGTIDYGAPYDVRAEDVQYWLDYVI